MKRFFRRIPFSVKLLLIGLIPLAFTIYLTIQLFEEKQVKVAILEGYIERIHQIRNISSLIDEMQHESKLSFDVVLRSASKENLFQQRKKTDEALKKFSLSSDELSEGSQGYSNVHKLPDIRSRLDNGKAGSNDIIRYYSNTIFWLNTLTSISISKNNPLQPALNDLRAQKLLAEIITYLSIIRTNIYNVLYTQKFMTEILRGTEDAYNICKSYENEFLAKASPTVITDYKKILLTTEYKPTAEYLDRVFSTMKFDSTYNADEWWNISDKGIARLSGLQHTIWNNAIGIANSIYDKEVKNKNRTLILLSLIIILVCFIISYAIYSITRMLRELKYAAEKISRGMTGTVFNDFANDAIGSLADSISRIDHNYQQLAIAADAIGRKNFDVPVHSRSDQDVLGNAILQMKKELQKFTNDMESLVAERTEELRKSNESLQEFAHVASHDLKEPLRKIRTFSSRIEEENFNELSDSSKGYLKKVQDASQRMFNMVEGILEYSGLNGEQDEVEMVDLNLIIKAIVSDLEIVIREKKVTINTNQLPVVPGIPVLLHQLFFNLISNAIKFSTPDSFPLIEIKSKFVHEEEKIPPLEAKKKYSCIEIKDNGIGFNAAQTHKIFELFTRLNNRSLYEGTGLGLSLCKKITERHQGIIYATGEKGKGASFFVVLPVRDMND
ncbi:MAG TPA: ATP-binding protein [Flavitalea sp.]|nr:ATP-binding protein [Flavitalea sp.]